MCHAYRLLFAVLIATVLTGACSGSSSTPTSPAIVGGSTALTSDQLAGTWRLTSVQPPGSAAQGTPAEATYSLTLADGRASTRADCNICNGAATLTTERLTIGPRLACTLAACRTMAFENTYVSVLAGDHSPSLDRGSLVLSSSRGVLRFER